MGESLVTVFHDSVNYNTKHKLQRSWTMWYDNPPKKATNQNWLANLKRIASVDTVEDFWGLFNNILKPSAIPIGANYHFFKTGVQPMWEDVENAKGGKWTYSIPKNKKDSLDSYWMNLLLAVVGEAFENGDNDSICGIVLSPRQKQDRIALWTKHASPCELVLRIGCRMKQVLGIDDDIKISFQQHEDSIKHTSTAAGPAHSHHPSSTPYSRDSRDLYCV